MQYSGPSIAGSKRKYGELGQVQVACVLVLIEGSVRVLDSAVGSNTQLLGVAASTELFDWYCRVTESSRRVTIVDPAPNTVCSKELLAQRAFGVLTLNHTPLLEFWNHMIKEVIKICCARMISQVDAVDACLVPLREVGRDLLWRPHETTLAEFKNDLPGALLLVR